MSSQPTEILTSSGEGYLTWLQPFQTVEQLQAQIASLTGEIERLRNDLRDWAECCQMDTVMQGPARMGWNRSALDRCLAKYEAALQPKEDK